MRQDLQQVSKDHPWQYTIPGLYEERGTFFDESLLLIWDKSGRFELYLYVIPQFNICI